MTCIAGLLHGGQVYIGGDSAGVGGYDLTVRADQKVFQVDDFLMGFTSSFRMGQLLRYRLSVPKRHPDTDVYRYMVTDFIDAVRECLKAGGYMSNHHGEEAGGTFMVGYAGRLFTICSDLQVAESQDGYMAVGCGDQIACGSLHATNTFDLPPKERLELALMAAERHSAGVRAPFTILSL